MKYYYCEQMKEDGLGGVCSTHEGDENFVQNLYS